MKDHNCKSFFSYSVGPEAGKSYLESESILVMGECAKCGRKIKILFVKKEIFEQPQKGGA